LSAFRVSRRTIAELDELVEVECVVGALVRMVDAAPFMVCNFFNLALFAPHESLKTKSALLLWNERQVGLQSN
jgi:hypothetical protein